MEYQPLNFIDNVAKSYEDILGPFVFEPFAVDLARRVAVTGTQNILELACGSGRLTNHLSQRVPGSSTFVASDLSPDMLEIAKTKINGSKVSWAVIDMQAIPYEDSHFDLVVCQFGLMLAPDWRKALAEIFRVLKKGGKLFFSTWASIEDNSLWSTASENLSMHFSKHPLASNPGPFTLSDENIVLEQLKTSGFKEAKVTPVHNLAEIDSAAAAANGFMFGLPVFYFVQNQAPLMLPGIVNSLAVKLADRLGDHPLKAPQLAWVFEATKISACRF